MVERDGILLLFQVRYCSELRAHISVHAKVLLYILYKHHEIHIIRIRSCISKHICYLCVSRYNYYFNIYAHTSQDEESRDVISES